MGQIGMIAGIGSGRERWGGKEGGLVSIRGMITGVVCNPLSDGINLMWYNFSILLKGDYV